MDQAVTKVPAIPDEIAARLWSYLCAADDAGGWRGEILGVKRKPRAIGLSAQHRPVVSY